MTLRLDSLTIHRFRDVRPETALRFDAGWNVMLGQNATGKTSLLNLISMALRGDFSELAREPFAVTYELSEGDWSATVALSHEVVEPADVRRLAMGDLTSQHRITGSIKVRRGEELESIVFPEERGQLQFGLHHWLMPSAIAHADKLQDSRRALLTRPLSSNHSYRFDEAIGLFRLIHGIVDEAPGLPNFYNSVAYKDTGGVATFFAFEPHGMRRLAEPDRANPTGILGKFDGCKHIQSVLAALEAHGLIATWPVTESSPSGENTILTLAPPTMLLQRNDGSAFSTSHLSFGQKRLFTFAWYLDANDGPVVADELVNGMHYAWIEDCVRAMEGRQVFVSAQNPLLLDHVGFARAEDVSSRFVLCRSESDANGKRVWVWTNPSSTQAEAFYRAYENGILQVHEILRTEGLW